MADDSGPVGIAKDNSGTHVDQFVDKEKPAFKHFLMNQNSTFGLCGNNQKNT